LPGVLVGGVSPDNDIEIIVTSLSFDSTQSIATFTYSGVGKDNGYRYKSLTDSNNTIANFIKDAEPIWPTY
jgi:hypothetical protein